MTTIWATDQPTEHVAAPHDERVQELAYELMRSRLNDLFGPGGSFRITLGRATVDDAIFVATVADTIAWDVAAALEEHEQATPRRAADQLPA